MGEQEWEQAPPGHPEWHRHGYLGPCLTGLFIFWCGEMKTGLSHGQHEVLLCEISRTGHFLRENLLSYSLPDWASLECWSALNLDPQSKMSETVKAYLMACIGNLNLVQVGWFDASQADLAIIRSGGIQTTPSEPFSIIPTSFPKTVNLLIFWHLPKILTLFVLGLFDQYL